MRAARTEAMEASLKPGADEAPAVRGGLTQFAPNKNAKATYNSLCAHDGCPCMEQGQFSDTIEHMVKLNSRSENCGGFMRCPMACGTFEP